MNRLLGSLAAALLSLSQAAFANEPPVVHLVSATPWVNDETTISYVVHDADDDVDGNLTYSLRVYPDAGLQTVADVTTFATMIADQRDVDPKIGTGDFTESTDLTDVQDYTWDDPGTTLANQGFAGAQHFLPGQYYLYLLADDGTNEPVMIVSEFAVAVARNATAVREISWGNVKVHLPLF